VEFTGESYVINTAACPPSCSGENSRVFLMTMLSVGG